MVKRTSSPTTTTTPPEKKRKKAADTVTTRSPPPLLEKKKAQPRSARVKIYQMFYCQNKSLICFSLHRKRHLHFVQIYNIYIYVYKVFCFFLYTNVHIFFTPYINTFENYKNVRPVLKKTHQTNKEKQNKNKHWALLRLNLKKKQCL